ncbi:MAG: hypothetical protein IJ424_00690 [Oscillospiraceae bacterium]|nr:hypothetical protein [Oscillospiraceae bacterium]
MEDIASKISEILSDEQSLKQLSELASMLGLTGEAPALPETPQLPANPSPSDMPFDIVTVMGLLSKFKECSKDDENINFLCALKPLLAEEKHERVDKAIKLIKLLNLWPVIKESGLLDSGGDLLGLL